jgi:hypothetical protein
MSVEAALSMVPHTSKLRLRIYEYVLSRGDEGATCDEVEHALGLQHQTASARIWELRGNGDHPKLLIDSGRKRRTRSGRRATVWVAL